ncbi:DUF1217 domain-containing protein [Limimaricola litoreus]|uniref:DUF1217 domain-containing protein n=1 Tax=Limimaricola litoreus TaxID=2955316 RepID=A0A9X2FSD3_9RHOB|nr:DUF1217 domain-containing protein [Limimaricola litoreus]MCP1169239.1 DUF1217 domain-containing protein [Limimaricola litoreus]
MISLSGLNTRMGLQLVDATRDRQIEMIRNSAEDRRAIEAFKERIDGVFSVDQLMEDRELYVFTMKAFGLEDQIFGKAMVEKILKSDPDDPKSLVNRLTDPRFREMHEVMGFVDEGKNNLNTFSTSWQNDMVDRYVEQRFENAQAEQNDKIGTVLEFRRKAGEINNWFDVLKDAEISEFMRTALGVPASVAGLDIDKQAELFAAKFDIAKLKDPAELESLERRYVAITDAKAGVQSSANAALALMNAAVATGAGGQFTPITLDISAITGFRSGGY